MISSVIPARLEFSCGHAALVSLPRLKGESAAQRTQRVTSEKLGARGRACDFCGPGEQTLVEVRPAQTAAPSVRNGHHAVDDSPTPIQRTETQTPVQATEAPGPIQRAEAPMPVPMRPELPASPLHLVPPVPQPTAPVAPLEPAATPAPALVSRRPRRRVQVMEPKPIRRRRVAPVAVSRQHRFHIRFSVQTTVRASDLRAALRQVESSGATDVDSIVLIET